jgi:ribosomal protein L37AE/L43A
VNDITCPWCEAELVLRVATDEQSCPECGTTWSYEDEDVEELALAA